MSSRHHRRESDRPKPSGPRLDESKSTDPPSNESQPNRPRPSGPRLMEVRPTGQRNVDPQPTEPGPSGTRIMGPRTNDPPLTSDQPQPGASGVRDQRQIAIMSLSDELARIRWRIETLYPLKAEQKEEVDCQKDKVDRMIHDKRSSRAIRDAKDELGVKKATLKETEGKLEQARREDEEVFMRRWRLQHFK
ncbi:copper radical oxidase [Fusarium phyllophilum]|uniref:Copper radical oxidase n=1 Tax=Fusarium phyllophilum TaxID=47803 RepID=A0A8H5JSL8_9HYPO|nr:copper radical oxidase [Fusarium phyllophilum]